jgi:2-polyprenyl-3-methyl-5-hydroxy-6-metoxy-1,4-benzoquinol methylase
MESDKKDGQITGLLSPFLEQTRLRQAARHIPAGAAILDIGCGRARILRHIAPPKRYVGLDVLSAPVESNRAAYPQHEFLIVDSQRADLAGLGAFDVILMVAVIEHFHHPLDVLRQSASRLTEHGHIVITTPHPRGERVLDVGARFRICSPEAHEEHQPLLRKEQLRDLAQQAGLRLHHYRTFLCGMNQLAILAR